MRTKRRRKIDVKRKFSLRDKRENDAVLLKCRTLSQSSYACVGKHHYHLPIISSNEWAPICTPPDCNLDSCMLNTCLHLIQKLQNCAYTLYTRTSLATLSGRRKVGTKAVKKKISATVTIFATLNHQTCFHFYCLPQNKNK